MAYLNVNYQKLIRQADELNTAADEMSAIADRTLTPALDSVEAAWRGSVSGSFLASGRRSPSHIRQEAEQLRAIASGLRDYAHKVREAEEAINKIYKI